MSKNRETYLETIYAINLVTYTDGLAYANLTRAQKVHTRSLVSDRYAAGFDVNDDQVTLDTEGALVKLTALGAAYVLDLEQVGLLLSPEDSAAADAADDAMQIEMLKASGEYMSDEELEQAVKPVVKRRRKAVKPSSKTIPPKAPKDPFKTVWVAGGAQDHRTVKKMSHAEQMNKRMAALEQALKAALASK